MKFKFKNEILNLLFLVLSFAFGAYFYVNFPDRVVTHWNFSGVPDGYSGKLFGAFGLPGIILLMYGIFLLVPALDPKKERYEEFAKVYSVFKSVLILVMLVVFLSTGFYNLGFNVSVNRVVPFAIGAMFLVLGNYMAKIKPNWFMGIRTPWTLSSEHVWTKTHRFASWVFMLLGIILIITPYFRPALGLGLFVFGILLATFGTFLYSYIIYKKENKSLTKML